MSDRILTVLVTNFELARIVQGHPMMFGATDHTPDPSSVLLRSLPEFGEDRPQIVLDALQNSTPIVTLEHADVAAIAAGRPVPVRADDQSRRYLVGMHTPGSLLEANRQARLRMAEMGCPPPPPMTAEQAEMLTEVFP